MLVGKDIELDAIRRQFASPTVASLPVRTLPMPLCVCILVERTRKQTRDAVPEQSLVRNPAFYNITFTPMNLRAESFNFVACLELLTRSHQNTILEQAWLKADVCRSFSRGSWNGRCRMPRCVAARHFTRYTRNANELVW